MVESSTNWAPTTQGAHTAQGSNATTEQPQGTPSSSDLFDGELLPEELIAIYNEAVGEGTSPEGNEEIPTLPPQPTATTTSSLTEKASDSEHPGAKVAEAAEMLDDTLGVGFKNSTSYNDLTTLLTPSGKPSGKAAGNDGSQQPGQAPPTTSTTTKAASTTTKAASTTTTVAVGEAAPSASNAAPAPVVVPTAPVLLTHPVAHTPAVPPAQPVAHTQAASAQSVPLAPSAQPVAHTQAAPPAQPSVQPGPPAPTPAPTTTSAAANSVPSGIAGAPQPGTPVAAMPITPQPHGLAVAPHRAVVATAAKRKAPSALALPDSKKPAIAPAVVHHHTLSSASPANPGVGPPSAVPATTNHLSIQPAPAPPAVGTSNHVAVQPAPAPRAPPVAPNPATMNHNTVHPAPAPPLAPVAPTPATMNHNAVHPAPAVAPVAPPPATMNHHTVHPAPARPVAPVESVPATMNPTTAHPAPAGPPPPATTNHNAVQPAPAPPAPATTDHNMVQPAPAPLVAPVHPTPATLNHSMIHPAPSPHAPVTTANRITLQQTAPPPTTLASSPSASQAAPAPQVAHASQAPARNPPQPAPAPRPASVPSNAAPAQPKKITTASSAQSTSQKPTANAVVPESAVSAPKAQSSKATEADFKTVAQAAVSSLILSTKNGEGGKPEAGGQGVNTSTAHIKALTGSNWVAACSGAGAAAVAAGGGNPTALAADAKANNRSKRQNLTADERARQNRDRNREHARNTRLRKKAYVEELKKTLTELVAQRDKAELEKRQAAQREVEQREVRFRVIEEFLKLRARNEANYASWAAILDPNFSLTLPATDFPSLVNGGAGASVDAANQGNDVKLEKVFSGVHQAMNESNSFALFLQSLGGDSGSSHYTPVGFVYNCERTNFFMDDSHAVLDWSAGTVGITKRGSQNEVTMRGSIRASFCPASNKLLSASLMFDTGAVLSQLQEFMTPSGNAYEVADAAQAASHRADAILDSLQMPQLDKPTIVPQGESSDEGH